MKMTIDALIEELEDARDDLGGDTEVRIAYQPNYPIRGTVAAVTIPPSVDDEDGTFVWLAVGSVRHDENPYAPEWALV